MYSLVDRNPRFPSNRPYLPSIETHLADNRRFKRNTLYRLSINRATISLAYVLCFAHVGITVVVDCIQVVLCQTRIERGITLAERVIKGNETSRVHLTGKSLRKDPRIILDRSNRHNRKYIL